MYIAALAAEVKKKVLSRAKALSHSHNLDCTPEGVFHRISGNGSLCRAYGTRIVLDTYPALKRWAKIFRPVPGFVRSRFAGFRSTPECSSMFYKVWTTLAVYTLVLGTFAAAQNITGKVTNATTGKPSAGDEVTLLSLSQGMQEVASTKSDAGRTLFLCGACRSQRSPHGARHPRWGELLPARWAADARFDDGRAHGLRLG